MAKGFFASTAAVLALLLALPAAAGTPSAQRPVQPSGRSLELPGYRPQGTPEGFELPQLPETSRESARAARRLFAIDRLAFTGDELLTDADRREATEALAGKRASLAEIESVRQQLVRRLIDRGYLNSGVVIPADGFAAGVLSFRVEAGHLTELRVEGQERLRADYIRKRLWPNDSETLHLPAVQERFQLLLADPLIARLNGRIVPGSRPGEALLDVKVTRARPYQLSVFGDNHRPPSIGAEVFGWTGWVRNLTGRGDLLDFTMTTGVGSERYSGGWSVPLNDVGSEFFVRFDEGAASVIEEPVQSLHIQSEVHLLEGGVNQTLVDRLRERFSLGLNFGVRRNETRISGRAFPAYAGDRDGQSQATVLRLSQDYLRRFDDDAVSLRSTFSVGLDALGASPRAVSFGPGGEFFAWLGQVQAAHRFNEDGLQAVVRGAVQLADRRLLPLEQMAVGGVGSVRGYRENHLVRDQGFTLSAELQVPVWTGERAGDRVLLIPFVDHGQAWNRNAAATAITSVGVGLRADYRQLHAEFFYGHGFDRTDPPGDERDLQDHGIHFMGRIDAF